MANEAIAPPGLGELIAEARRRLAAAGIGEAALDARLLVEHCTGTTRADAIARPRQPVDPVARTALDHALARRLAGEPVHRIIGWREFFGLRLSLAAETLEPRPDTEAVVEAALPIAREAVRRYGHCRVLDLGTGTGAIALAILGVVPAASVVATDIARNAVATARANADMNGLGERFEARESDWFDGIEGRFHLIVSNPPYIPTREIAMLAREVCDHDPRRALDGGEDGLDAYRAIAAGAHGHLEPGARIVLEIGHGQAAVVAAVFSERRFRLAATRADLAGTIRALTFAAA